MKKVPCIICLKKVDVNDKKIIAVLCNECTTDENIKNVGKNFTYQNIKNVLEKSKEQTTINKYGELV